MDRRRFLAAVSAAGLALPLELTALAQQSGAVSSSGGVPSAGPDPAQPAALPNPATFSNEDAFWAEMRQQFLIPADEVYLNNGTVGSSPWPVLNAIFDAYNSTEKLDQQDPEDYPIWGYAAWNEFRDPLASFVGCSRDEIALLRNATEANSYI